MRLKEINRKGSTLFLVLISFIFVASAYALAPAPTVLILNPKPGISTSPTILSLRPTTNDFMVQTQVWNDVADITAVNAGYCLSTADPNNPANWTWSANAAVNANYNCGTNCAVYEVYLSGLTAGSSYFLRARAISAADGTGYSSDNRTGNDARYIYATVKAAGTGDGMLLRRDSSNELCLDCHDLATHSSQSTSAKYGSWGIGCRDCHTPHTTKNIYLVRETIRTPNSGSAAVDFRNTTGDAAYSYAITGAGNGICEVCHTQTTGPGGARWRNSGNTDTHYTAASGTLRCTSCHVHLQGFKGACDSCHNSPPTTGKHATHFGTGSVNYGTTTIQSTASAYGFSCGICHYGTHINTLPQSANPHTVEVIFAGVGTQDPDNPPPGAANYAPAAFSVDDPGKGWTFNYSPGTCTNTYCHGNYPGSGKNASPTFGAASTAPCGSCHGASNNSDAMPVSGNHEKHADSDQTIGGAPKAVYNREYSCILCHKGIAGGTGPAAYTVTDKSKHVNGYIDWNFDTTDPRVSASSVYNIASGTAVPSDGATPRTYSTCNNVYCHSIVQTSTGGALTPNSADYKTPTWGTSIGCGGCHKGDDGHVFGNVMDSGSHTKHLLYEFNLGGSDTLKCTVCHKWNSSAAFADCNQCHASSGEKTLHVNGLVNVLFETYFGNGTFNGTATPGDGYSNCSNTYCHSTGTSVSTGSVPNNTTTNWGSGVLACNACHGNATYADYRRAAPLYANGSPKKNAHQLHVRANGSAVTDPSCSMCHYSVTTNNTTIASTSLHVNKTYNISASGAGIQYPAWAGVGTGSNGNVTVTYAFNATESTCNTVSCHPDGLSGGTTTKWSEGYSCTDCHNIDLTGTTGYHHVMDATAMANRTYPTSAPSSSATDANRKCTMCHADHNVFSPMLNASSTGRAYNLRTDIASAPIAGNPPATGNYTNLDFDNALANGGICVSCHQSALTKNTTNQKDDTTTTTPTISKATYNTSSHNYPSNPTSTFTSTPSGSFNANCSKCHTGYIFGKTYQGSTNKFKLHDQALRRLVSSLGIASPTDPEEEDFCYRCHSYLADAIGGTKKPAANNDWYGVVTTMTAASQDIYTSMQSGTAGTPSGTTTTTNTLYFKPSAQETPSGVAPADHYTTTQSTNIIYLKSSTDDSLIGTSSYPNAYYLASGTYSAAATTYWRRVMSLTTAATNENTAPGNPTAANQFQRQAQFISLPLSSAWSVANGATFNLCIDDYEGNAGSNGYTRYNIRQYTGAAAGTTLYTGGAPNNAVQHATEMGNNVAATYYSQSINLSNNTGGAVNFAAGDTIVLEAESTNTTTTYSSHRTRWGGALQGGQCSGNARLTLPTNATFQVEPFAGGTANIRSMSPFVPTAADETIGTATDAVGTNASAANPVTQRWKKVVFVSPPVATAATTTAAAWSINIYDNESSGNANARVRYMIYSWTSVGAFGSTIVPRTTYTVEMGLATALQAITTAAGNAVALAVGDKIVVDLEIESNAVTAGGNYNLRYIYGQTNQSNVVMPDNVTFTYNTPGTPASGRHDVALYSGKHKPSPTDETRSYIATNKHVECADCHDPHEAYRGNHAYSRTATAGGATSLTDGSAVGWTSDMWKGYSVRLTSGTGLGQNRQISTNTPTVLTTGPTNWTTNPANGTGYTIMLLNNTGLATAGGANTLTDGNKTGNSAWVTNVWAGWTVTIVSGTGAGQQRVISSNTGTVLTASSNWTTNPDNTSRYTINKAPGVQVGVTGVGVTTWGGNWAGVTTYNPSLTTAALVTAQATWEVCFKCHSSANAQITGTWSASGAAAFTDLGLEFNPNNRSGHPVVTSLNNYPNSPTPKALTTARMLEPWLNVGNQTMTCLDCHATDSTASKGPHGSSVKWMLAGTNKAWPYTTTAGNGGSTGTLWTYNNQASGTANGVFCLNCHVIANSPHTTTSDHQGTACVNCHIRVPHGGKVSRLITTRNGNPGTSLPARYHPNGNGGGGAVYITSFIKPAAGYGTGNCAVTGCSSHGAIAGESW